MEGGVGGKGGEGGRVESRTVVEVNVGGVVYSTTVATLTRYPDSVLSRAIGGDASGGDGGGGDDDGSPPPLRDSVGRRFFDRDGPLFRFVLDFLRTGDDFRLPDDFRELGRIRREAEFYRLPEMIERLPPKPTAHAQSQQQQQQHRLSLPLWSPSPATGVGGGGVGDPSPSSSERDGFSGSSPLQLHGITVKEPGYVVVGYRGSFQLGRDGQADVKFRKLTRILVSGRVSICREVFQDTLNESRDPDRGTSDRYSARFFLKHGFLEQAFDMLQEAGFCLVGTCGSGTTSVGEAKPGIDREETKWNHYNEFIFCRP